MHSTIADNSAALVAVGPILFGLFSFAWITVRQSWRLFGLGFLMFSIPFLLFIASNVLAVQENEADLKVFVVACGSLATCTVIFGFAVLVIWRGKERKATRKDFGQTSRRR